VLARGLADLPRHPHHHAHGEAHAHALTGRKGFRPTGVADRPPQARRFARVCAATGGAKTPTPSTTPHAFTKVLDQNCRQNIVLFMSLPLALGHGREETAPAPHSESLVDQSRGAQEWRARRSKLRDLLACAGPGLKDDVGLSISHERAGVVGFHGGIDDRLPVLRTVVASARRCRQAASTQARGLVSARAGELLVVERARARAADAASAGVKRR